MAQLFRVHCTSHCAKLVIIVFVVLRASDYETSSPD